MGMRATGQAGAMASTCQGRQECQPAALWIHEAQGLGQVPRGGLIAAGPHLLYRPSQPSCGCPARLHHHAGSSALDRHVAFVSKLQDTINNGVGNLVDADLAKESAHLQALQTKQQLGFQALSIANSATSPLLSLFR